MEFVICLLSEKTLLSAITICVSLRKMFQQKQSTGLEVLNLHTPKSTKISKGNVKNFIRLGNIFPSIYSASKAEEERRSQRG